uniref:Uncharacterized protein n=1 Tax=uncultured marine virus TaxID=186617 RepID=A0A0F7L8L7_9VIRU|nr:hypothetical protein [uncultured marine virus]
MHLCICNHFILLFCKWICTYWCRVEIIILLTIHSCICTTSRTLCLNRYRCTIFICCCTCIRISYSSISI